MAKSKQSKYPITYRGGQIIKTDNGAFVLEVNGTKSKAYPSVKELKQRFPEVKEK